MTASPDTRRRAGTAAVAAAAAAVLGLGHMVAGSPALATAPGATVGAPVQLIGEPVPLFASTASLFGDLDGLTVTITDEGVELSTAADVLFDFDSAALTPDAVDLLDEVVAALTEAGPDQVLVVGHTDAIGTDDYNRTLSTERAEAVAAALTDRDELGDVDFRTEGRGADEPVAEELDEDGEDLPEGRARNRRVELLFSAPTP